MPNKLAIQQEILELKGAAQDKVRRGYLKNLFDYTRRNTLVYASDAFSARTAGIPPLFTQITKEDVQGFMSALHGVQGNQLDIVLNSGGGSLEAAELIVNYLRSKFDNIRVIVPLGAMSAATMIACACDEIIMSKHSCIGPIDPQITLPTQNNYFTASAFSILSEFSQAMSDVNANPNTAVLWGAKIKDYPPGILSLCQQFSKLSVVKVEQWLKTFMFRDDVNKEKKAKEIAQWLGDAQQHMSHGRPITYNVAKEHGLNISLLEDDQELQERVLSLFHAVMITFEVTNCVKFIENHTGQGWFQNVNLPK